MELDDKLVYRVMAILYIAQFGFKQLDPINSISNITGISAEEVRIILETLNQKGVTEEIKFEMSKPDES